jgi:two-component system sensor kinase FixL
MDLRRHFQKVAPGWMPFAAVAITALAGIIVSVCSLLAGSVIIFQNLLYVPIIIACMYYTKRGFLFSIMLSLVYLLLIVSFTGGSVVVVLEATMRVFLFVGIAGVVTFLSARRRQVEQELRRHRANLEQLVEDRTARLERMAKEAQQLQQRIEFVLGATNTGLNIIDSEFQVRYIDPERQRVYGDPRGRTCYEYFWGRRDTCPDCGAVRTKAAQQVLVTEELLPRYDDRPIQVTRIPFQDENGDWLIAEINVDIAERKRAEEALRRSEEKYHQLFNNALVGMFRATADGSEILDVNEKFLEIFGGTRDALVDSHAVLPWAYPQEREELLRRLAVEGRVTDFECRMRNERGEVRVCLMSLRLYREHGILEGSVRDITEQRRAEEQALQQQTELLHLSRLSILGEMATELAHELNQPLSAITTYGGACLRQVQAAKLDRARLLRNQQRVLEQAMQAREVMGRIRAFAARRRAPMARVTLGEVIRSAVALMQCEMRRKNIELKLKPGDGQIVILADVVALGQVLVNLLRNAEEALESTCSASSVTIETRVTPAKQAEVLVSDTGPGVSEEDLPRLFDPFFTTKPAGLGIGLSIGRRITEMHGGTLAAQRNPEGGLTFIVTVPLAPPEGQENDPSGPDRPDRQEAWAKVEWAR